MERQEKALCSNYGPPIYGG